MMRILALLCTLPCWLNLTCSVLAQPERLELGKRLRRFELAWEGASESKRQASAKPMVQAVNRFFGLQFAEAMEKLDESWRCVDDRTLSDRLAAGVRFQISQSQRILEPPQASTPLEITLKLVPTYGGPLDPSVAPPKVCWEVQSPAGETLARRELDWNGATSECLLPFRSVGDGDYLVKCRLEDGDQELPLLPNRLSVISNWDTRLAAAEKFYQSSKDDEQVSKTARATLGECLSWLRAMKKNIPSEIEYPGNQLLAFCEALIANTANFSQWLSVTSQQQDCWLTLARENRRVAVRLKAPPDISQPLPVLFLFHGAGGSENMFFETYGAGRAVQEGIQRGWLVIAPRLGFAGPGLDCSPILDELSQHFPIDRSRVLMLGHSMGAAQVVRQATLEPTLPRALVALGGGAKPGKLPEVAKLPWFIAAGELDFGKRSATTLRDALTQNRAERTEYREYPGVEHMVIVQAALGDAFAFMDKQLTSSP